MQYFDGKREGYSERMDALNYYMESRMASVEKDHRPNNYISTLFKSLFSREILENVSYRAEGYVRVTYICSIMK